MAGARCQKRDVLVQTSLEQKAFKERMAPSPLDIIREDDGQVGVDVECVLELLERAIEVKVRFSGPPWPKERA